MSIKFDIANPFPPHFQNYRKEKEYGGSRKLSHEYEEIKVTNTFMMKNIGAIISIISLISGLAMPVSASTATSSPVKKTYAVQQAPTQKIPFAYPKAWGTLSRVESTVQNDGDIYPTEYQTNVLRYRTSNPTIEKVWYHVPTKTLAYTHADKSKTELFVRKSNGTVVKVDFVKNKENKNDDKYGYYSELNFSPRAFFIFTEVHGFESCASSAFDIRTGKRANIGGCFDPTRDVYFSADATRMAIRVPFLEIYGETSDILFVQDPKSLTFKKVFTFPQVSKKEIYQTGTIEKIAFDSEVLLYFVAITRQSNSDTFKETEKKAAYIYHYKRGILQPLDAPLVSFDDLSEKNIGNRVGDWTIASLNKEGESQGKSVQFSGEVTIEGRYYQGIYGRIYTGSGPCFIPDLQYVSKFSQMNSGDSFSKERIHLCFSNGKEAEKLLGTHTQKIGVARIIVGNFKLIDSEGGDEIGTVVLKKVLSRASASICDYPDLGEGGEGWSWSPVDPQYEKFSALGALFTREKCSELSKEKTKYIGPSWIEVSGQSSSRLQKDFKKLGYYCDLKGKTDAVCSRWQRSCIAVSEKDFLILKKYLSSFKSIAPQTEWGCLDKNW